MEEIKKILQDHRQVNLGLRKLASELTRMEESDRLSLFTRYEELFLKSKWATRVTEETKRSLVATTFPGEVNEAIKSYPPFKFMSGGTSSTYLLTCHGSEKFGAVYRLALENSGVDGSVNRLKPAQIDSIRGLAEDYINSFLPSNQFLILENAIGQKSIRLTDALNLPPGRDVNVEGASSGLPLFLLYLSQLTGKPMPVDTAMTGEIDPNLNVVPVDGIRQKIEALRLEYPDVKKLLIPEGNMFDIQESFEGLEILVVNTVAEAVELVFGDLSEAILQQTDHVLRFVKEVKEIEFYNRQRGETETRSVNIFSLKTKSYPMNIPTKIMHKLDLARETTEAFESDPGWYWLDNVRPLWYSAFLAARFFNKVSMFAVTDTGGNNNQAIVVFAKGQVGVIAGDRIKVVEKSQTTE
ncbi:MAG: hypothetical protein AMXMBFR49_19860 [Chlorobiota bacterium]